MVPLRLALLPFLVLLVVACGGGAKGASLNDGVIVATVTSPPPDSIASGGKPAQPPVVATNPAPTATPPAVVTNPTATAPAAVATPTTVAASTAPQAPTTGRWIDVDVTRYRVRLMNGTQVLQTIEPVAVGAQVDTGAYESTQTGLYRVYNKIAGLQYDAPYKSYISDWVGFDPAKDNGFHSFLQDATGSVTDPSTGRVSNGCIRTGASAAIYAFAEVGMPVLVHS